MIKRNLMALTAKPVLMGALALIGSMALIVLITLIYVTLNS